MFWGALGAVVGALISAGVAYLVHRHKLEADVRAAEKQLWRDKLALASVLEAEIRSNTAAAAKRYETQTRESILAAMAGKPRYVPFILHDEAPAPVFQAMLDRLALLDAAASRVVVEYYSMDNAVNFGIRTLRDRDFLLLDGEDPGAGGTARGRRRETFVKNLFNALDEIYPLGRGQDLEAVAGAVTARPEPAALSALKELAHFQERCRRELARLGGDTGLEHGDAAATNGATLRAAGGSRSHGPER